MYVKLTYKIIMLISKYSITKHRYKSTTGSHIKQLRILLITDNQTNNNRLIIFLRGHILL